MKHVPGYIKSFLRNLPDSWEDIRFLGGTPGKDFLVARKSGNTWYLAGINGEKKDKELVLDLSFLTGKNGDLYYCPSDNEANTILTRKISLTGNKELSLKLHGNDGFIAVFED